MIAGSACTALAMAFAQVLGPSPVARQVVAPASDITSGVVRLPEPASTATRSRSSLAPLRFVREGAGWSATFELAVEREGGWSLALLSPAVIEGRVLAAPRGRPLRPIDASFALERRVSLVGDELPGWVVDRRDLRGAPAGPWIVRIEVDRASQAVDGWFLATTAIDIEAEAFVATHERVRGPDTAVCARATGTDFGSVERASLEIDAPGETRELAMLDDGEHGDGIAGDGLFGAFLPEDLLGPLALRAQLRGTTVGGLRFARTVPLALELHERPLALDGSARLAQCGDTTWRLELGAVQLDSARRLHVSAEVWGQSAGGPVPLCWLSRMLEPGAALELEFDERWLDVAQASGPLELRHLRVQDPDSEGVLAQLARVEVDSAALASRAPSLAAPPPGALLAAAGIPVGPFPEISEQLLNPALMLVHGYCSSGSIWPAAHFSQPKLEFLDPNANRSHDQFAQLIASRAAAAQLSSFGVVAHSQGGSAALHLLTYYTSGLDVARGPRRIQSVATPYLGTPLASLGFFACGVNSNMTPSGAATWLAGIPTWARAEVSYWTTSNTGSTCSALTGFLLSDPEDGTIERTRGQLVGANSIAHVLGWCHTTGMSNPASYTDATRNQAMNVAAAR